MRYAYYARLRKADQKIYRQSDAVAALTLQKPAPARQIVKRLQLALERQDRGGVEAQVRALCAAIVSDLGARPLAVKVLAVRPSHDWGELHGLYEPAEGRQWARLTVWMRTARQKNVVAFRSFLRTVLHELCHHLDYETLGLEDSFHTEGFFRRESSLFRQLVSDAAQASRRSEK